MKKVQILIIFLLSIVFGFGQSQTDLPKIIPPSPTVGALMQFEEIPVNHYSGQPNISIPIISKKLNNSGLNFNISLNYNTQGVKINNRSSWTGTSWSLFAGGSISRTVRGIPDEVSKSFPGINTGVLHLNDYWNYDTLSLEDKNKFNWKASGGKHDKYDTELDLYQFNFLNYSGRFVIIKENGVLIPKFISKSHNFKIVFNFDLNYVISDFTIIDTKGYKYIFDSVEVTASNSVSGFLRQGEGEGTIPFSGASQSYFINSAWHLSRIDSSNGEELVRITYTISEESYTSSINITDNRLIVNWQGSPAYSELIAIPYNRNILKPKRIISYYQTVASTKKIASIVFKDSTKVLFDVNNFHPETNGVILKKIRIENGNGTENKIFQLHYENSTDYNTTPASHRLWLTKIVETAGFKSNEYKLNYNNKDNLPGFNSVKSDDWGYYSGIELPTLPCGGINLYNTDIIKTGLLKSIVYPTGGVKEFEFEHNSFSYFGNDTITYNEYIKNPNNLLPSNSFSNFSYQNPQEHLSMPQTVDSITLDFIQDIYVSIDVQNGNTWMNNYKFELTNNNNFGKFIPLDKNCFLIKNVPAGNYELKLHLYNNLTTDNYLINGTVRLSYNKPNNILLKKEMIGGGIRIKEIAFRDTETSLSRDNKITFSYQDENDSTYSSGVIDSRQDKLSRNFLQTETYILKACSINSGVLEKIITFETSQKGKNVELSQGAYVSYRFVKVSKENNGFQTYKFTSAFDFPNYDSAFDLPNGYPKQNLDYKRGLLLENCIYKDNNDIIKKISNLNNIGEPNYSFDEEYLFKSRYAFKLDNASQFFTSYDFYKTGNKEINPIYCSSNGIPINLGHRYYGPTPQYSRIFNSGWAKLNGTKTIDYFYDTSGNQSSIEIETSYTYNSENYQPETIQIIDSEQKVLKKEFIYATSNHPSENFTSGENMLINQMFNKNIIGIPILTKTYKNTNPLATIQSIYKNGSPFKVQTSKGSNPLEDRIIYHKYDDAGNPLELSKADGKHISYIWGYNKTQPIAKLINIEYDNIPQTQLNTLLNFDYIAGTEADLLTALNSLRTVLPNTVQLTTITYKPLIGISTITDFKGDMQTYHYDNFNRLKYVKDSQGNILSKNEYHYRTEN